MYPSVFDSDLLLLLYFHAAIYVSIRMSCKWTLSCCIYSAYRLFPYCIHTLIPRPCQVKEMLYLYISVSIWFVLSYLLAKNRTQFSNKSLSKISSSFFNSFQIRIKKPKDIFEMNLDTWKCESKFFKWDSTMQYYYYLIPRVLEKCQ